jgi:hypothetical protein
MASKVVPLRENQADIAPYDHNTRQQDGNPEAGAKAEVPAVKKRKRARKGWYLPATAWPEFAVVVASGVSGRSLGLWCAIRMQAKVEKKPWVRVRTPLQESLGFDNRAAPSRAVAELEKHGFIQVERRPGRAPLVRLVPQRAGDGEDDG